MLPVKILLSETWRKRLGKVWRSSLGKWFKKVDFWIVCRDLDLPDVPLPQGRHSPIKEGETFVIDHASHDQVAKFDTKFPGDKVRLLHKFVDHPEVDLVVRMRDDGKAPWCYMLHASCNLRDPLYGYRLDLVHGRDILQFDGWVDPEYRGLMIGILGTNSANKLRRAEGFERIYATVRKKDKRSIRLHDRLGFETVGEIVHRRIFGLRINKVIWHTGKAPSEGREPGEGTARLLHPQAGCMYTAEVDRIDDDGDCGDKWRASAAAC